MGALLAPVFAGVFEDPLLFSLCAWRLFWNW